MSALVIYPDGGKGGPEFAREATKYMDWYHKHATPGVVMYPFRYNGPVVARCRAISDLIGSHLWTEVVFFCHGLEQSIQPGFSKGGQFRRLATALQGQMTLQRVTLYCCSTAGGPGPNGNWGFADRLRDAARVEVVGHVGAGHTSRRPYIRYFDSWYEDGGQWLAIPPGQPGHDAARWARLRALLRTDFRFELSTLPWDQVRAKLEP